ncbi:N-acetylglucosamine kinase [Cohnella sp. JJ-181]|uniref:N-acetylglucosamine kinase n=1 Tax=Cohnella rhizoplanae TaxID=2974897 RepID=UPI0022FF63AB|nr:BadF/BadG/BcrA/BcrD ATPase family protein [Cohnella sp. JJ-181]CAI6081596.1 N-acetylmuramic acid/N-acetylglucosamine kinase [Cohnella sp. JJ-181]
MKYYLGVDGGGSKTYALVADERGRVVGKGRSGNGNHQIDRETARRSVREATDMALAAAGISREQVAYACFGLAGADREADYRILRPMIAELGFARHDIHCDTIIAMRAGTSRPYGVVLICGSGTNGAGRNPAGESLQVGGFTYATGDFGGGAALAVEAFRTVIRAWDGREEETALTPLVLEEMGYAGVEEMFHDCLDRDRQPPLSLAKLLFEAAEGGDAAARAILRRQGEELGKQASAIIRRLGMADETFDVVLAGSILTRGKGDFVHSEIRRAVAAAAPAASVAKLAVEPVVGALWMAFEADGPLPEPARETLKDAAEFDAI